MGGCQNYGPFLGTLHIRGRIIIGIQKGTIILTTSHMALGYLKLQDVATLDPQGKASCLYYLGGSKIESLSGPQTALGKLRRLVHENPHRPERLQKEAAKYPASIPLSKVLAYAMSCIDPEP